MIAWYPSAHGLASKGAFACKLTLGGSADVGPPLVYVGEVWIDGPGIHGMRVGGNLLTIVTRLGAIVVTRVKVLLAPL